jgi:hypothetical protein
VTRHVAGIDLEASTPSREHNQHGMSVVVRHVTSQ